MTAFNQLSWSVLPTGRPWIVAHRGAMRYAPQNTMPSFHLAQKMGADALEFDVQLSRDGVPVVFHDATMKKLTGEKGPVSRHSWKSLSTLDAGLSFSPAFRFTPIPRLEDVLNTFGGSLLLNLELKSPALTASGGLQQNLSRKNFRDWKDQNSDLVLASAAVLHGWVESHKPGVLNSLLVSSFDPVLLHQLRLLVPGVRTAQLQSAVLRVHSKTLASESDFGPLFAIHPEQSACRRKLVAQARAKGMLVNAWTVNKPERVLKLVAKGVTGLITNEPGVLRELFAGKMARADA